MRLRSKVSWTLSKEKPWLLLPKNCFCAIFRSNISNRKRRFQYCPYTCQLKYHIMLGHRLVIDSPEMRVALSLLTSSVILTSLVTVLISDLFCIKIAVAFMFCILIRVLLLLQECCEQLLRPVHLKQCSRFLTKCR